MRYHVQAPRQETVTVEVETLSPGHFAVTLDGKRHEIDAQLQEGDNLSLLWDGASHWAQLETKQERTRVRLGQDSYDLEVLDERRFRLREATPTASLEGRQQIRSPMPGKVVKLLVKQGDTVTEGQGLVVVEAMKMENELKSPKAGTVVEVSIAEGTTVEGQALLVSVE